MHPELQGFAASQSGLFTRRQALACGYRERTLKTQTGHGGGWHVVRRGVYVEREVWARSTDRERYLLRVRAAVLTCSREHVVSHTSAAALLGMPLRPAWCELVHLTRPGVSGGRAEHGVKHHLAAYRTDDTLQRSGLMLTNAARTALDLAREFGYEAGVIAADFALGSGSTREQLATGAELMHSWPGVTQVRMAVELADGGAETIGESLTRLLVVSLGMGRPETQFLAHEGTRRARVNLRLRRHLIEFDGKVKYLGREDGGVANRPASEVVWAEKQREDWLRGYDGGHGVSRVVWADLMPAARDRTGSG